MRTIQKIKISSLIYATEREIIRWNKIPSIIVSAEGHSSMGIELYSVELSGYGIFMLKVRRNSFSGDILIVQIYGTSDYIYFNDEEGHVQKWLYDGKLIDLLDIIVRKNEAEESAAIEFITGNVEEHELEEGF